MKLSYWEQIKYAAVRRLSRLLANLGCPTASKMRLLMAVTELILLDGCEIWADALKTEEYREESSDGIGAEKRRRQSSIL